MKDLQKQEISVTLSKGNVVKSDVIGPISVISSSLKTGLVGFTVVFCLILFTKALSISLNAIEHFSLGINDFILSFWGFIVLSFVVFGSKFKNYR